MKKKLSNTGLIIGILSLFFIILFMIFSQSSTEDSSQENINEIYEGGIVRPLLNIEENNGIVTNIWITDKKKLEKFVKNNIKYLFVDVGNIDKNGKIIKEGDELEHFLELIEGFEKEKNYDFVLLPYSEIIIDDSNKKSITSDLFTDNFINSHKELIELGFDGAHIDIEAIPFNQRGDYIKFLKKLDSAIGKKNMITVYSGSLNENPNIWEWGPAFYHSVADNVDIILIPSYDFYFNDKEEYQTYVKGQVKSIASQEWDAKFMFTAPTHKPNPETLTNALEAYKEEIEKHEKNSFIGITIFAEWTTNEEEWKIFENYFK